LWFFAFVFSNAQADNEIQVYASPTIQYKWTIFELHSNYTFKKVNYCTIQKPLTGQMKHLKLHTAWEEI
jgi:hypothetical protein